MLDTVQSSKRLNKKQKTAVICTNNGQKGCVYTMINTNIYTDISVPYPQKLVKIIVDEKGYKNKPKKYMGAITNRMAASKNACELDLIKLANYITNGHAFSVSYAEGGMSDNNFVSSDLVGLDFDGELTVNEVLGKLKEHNIPANIVYYTYSHGEKGERFRVITALSETITNKDEYKQIIKGYQSLFGSDTDNATVGAVQRFLGTNKGLVQDVDAYSTVSKQIFLDLYKKNHKIVEIVPTPTNKSDVNINDFDLQKEIDNYNLLDYIRKTYPNSEFKPSSGGVFVNPCPLCGHNDHLHITGNKFHSFGDKNCLALGGIGIVQWLIFTENLTSGQAIGKFKYEILGIDEKQDKRAYAQAIAQKENNQPSNDKNNVQKKPYFKIESLESELQKREIEVKYNTISCETEFFKNSEKSEISENFVTEIYSSICDKYLKITHTLVEQYLCYLAEKNKYNPVLDLFNANEWDKQNHLTKVYDVLGIAEDDNLSRILLLKWFWQGHALIRNSDKNPFGADGVLTLTGKQGIGKTSFFRHMALHSVNSDFFKEGQKIKSLDKDTIRRCHTAFITELGELGSTFKFAHIDDLKAFITQSKDQYRLPYGHKDIKKARRCNLSATVNDKEFLVDRTGNRRFWTVPVENIDLDGLKEINALQVWLQVWEQYAKHNLQGFRLTKDEQNLLSERNSQHERSLKSEDEIRDILDEAETKNIQFNYMTVSIFKEKYPILKNYTVNQIGIVLDKLGIEMKQRRINGKSSRVRLLPDKYITPYDYSNI